MCKVFVTLGLILSYSNQMSIGVSWLQKLGEVIFK